LTSQKRYLITTADENTWKFDRPVIFLGEWCRLYNRKHIWGGMDAIVAEPYGLKHSKRDSDYSKALILENKLFPEFIQLLNYHHNTNHSERFWQILIGPWFKVIVRDLFYYVNSLKNCLLSHDISGTTGYDLNKTICISDTKDFIDGFFDDNRNLNLLYTRILNLIENKNFPVDLISSENENTQQKYNLTLKKIENKSFYKNFLKLGFSFYSKISKQFIRKDDAFIINTFLPTEKEAKLELALGQFPQFWKYNWNKHFQFDLLKKNPDNLIRKNLKKKFLDNSCESLENIIRHLLFEYFPVCYLEGFGDLFNKLKKQPWPKFPKFIFTSNNFYLDEVFKLYAALNVESGKKYFVGQHGGNYGTQRHKSPRIEELTVDKFITWGWTNGMSQHIPGFVLKNAGKKKLNFNTSGNLLLIEHGYTKHDATYDKKSDFIEYLDNQKTFVDNLHKNPRKNLLIRLFNINYQNKDWCEENRWHDFDPNIKIDNGIKNINRLISKSRLIVYSYDSTGMLETLSDNIPTIAFWGKEVALLDSAKPYYQMLADVGIIHFSAISAAEKINEIWDNVENWWDQSNLQKARQEFCHRYAKKSQNPVTELKQILLS
tara:strand:+ start:2759 stop:4564 length:1806 start_codon:yes stop_codon:yes gene_type:complete